jgi:hypothetical protein
LKTGLGPQCAMHCEPLFDDFSCGYIAASKLFAV